MGNKSPFKTLKKFNENVLIEIILSNFFYIFRISNKKNLKSRVTCFLKTTAVMTLDKSIIDMNSPYGHEQNWIKRIKSINQLLTDVFGYVNNSNLIFLPEENLCANTIYFCQHRD